LAETGQRPRIGPQKSGLAAVSVWLLQGRRINRVLKLEYRQSSALRVAQSASRTANDCSRAKSGGPGTSLKAVLDGAIDPKRALLAITDL